MSRVPLIEVANRTYRLYPEQVQQAKEYAQHVRTLMVPPKARGAVWGGRRSDRYKSLEELTSTRIECRSKGDTLHLVIRGNEEGKVDSCLSALKRTILHMEHDLSHFVSLPLNLTHLLDETYDIFKEDALAILGRDPNNRSLFVPTHKLHLTIAVLSLNEQELHLVQQLFAKDLADKLGDLLAGETLSIELRGLDIMKGTVGKEESGLLIGNDHISVDDCHVLYVKIVDNARLQELGGIVLQSLANFGLVANLDVKWHCTLMNTKYRKEATTNPAHNRGFDARKILHKFGNMKFGTIQIDEMHLSSFTKKPHQETGYYAADSIIKLLPNK